MSNKPSAEQAPAGQPDEYQKAAERIVELTGGGESGDVQEVKDMLQLQQELSRSRTECDELRSQLAEAELLRQRADESRVWHYEKAEEARAQLSTTRGMLAEKQDEADALRKALEHETQSHLETCNRESTGGQIARALAAALESKHGPLPGVDCICITCNEYRPCESAATLERARAAGLLDDRSAASGTIER